MARPRSRFVGREAELSALRTMVEDGADIVLVTGEAGIGKSRLLSEVLATSGTRMVGACLPLRRQRPLLPFQEMFAGNDIRRELDRALATMSPRLLDALAGVLPERSGLLDVPPQGVREVDTDQVFIGIRTLLTALAAGDRLLVAVEDVHWADPVTSDLLTFLSAQLRGTPVTLVATFRTDDPESRTPEMLRWLSNVQRANGAELLHLDRLSRDDIAAQVESLLGESTRADFLEGVFRRGEGNPFFTEQLVAAMTGTTAGAELPQRLADFLGARVRGASPEQSRLLEVLALAARPLPIRSLFTVAALDDLDAQRALVGLVQAALVEVRAGALVRARHALLNEAVLREVPTIDRTELHRRLAAVLAADHGDELAAEIADHWHEAGYSDQELRWAEKAADRAWSVGAWADAAGWLRRVIDLAEVASRPTDSTSSIVDVWCRAIRATDLSGEGARSWGIARVAYLRFHDWPEVTERARVVRYYAHVQLTAEQDLIAGQATLESILPALEQLQPTEEHADVLLLYGASFVWQGDSERAIPILEKAMSVADACGSVRLATTAALRLAQAWEVLGDDLRAADMNRRAHELSVASGDPVQRVAVAVDHSDHLLESGDLVEARRVALEALEVAKENGLAASWMPHILVYNAAQAALEQGLTDLAAQLVTELTDHPLRDEVGPMDELRAEVDLRRGHVTECLSRLESTTTSVSIDEATDLAARITWARRWAGQPHTAITEALAVAEQAVVTDADHLSGLLATAAGAAADVAELARARRDEAALDATAGTVTRLRELAARFAGGRRRRVQKPVEHREFLAELSRARGDLDPGAWRPVVEAWTELGRPHRAAYACWRQAQVAIDLEADRATVTEALQKAFDLSDGHVPLRNAVTGLAARARIHLVDSSVADRAPDPAMVELPVSLTNQETKVLRLVAAGMTNSQIGTELFISPKTVSVHVSNLLRKLDVHSRVQAAAWADQVGLGRSS